MSLMRSACTGFECQIFMFPEERLYCECDVIKLLVRIDALLQRTGGQREGDVQHRLTTRRAVVSNLGQDPRKRSQDKSKGDLKNRKEIGGKKHSATHLFFF